MTAKENEFLNIHPYFHIDPAIERAADRALSEAQEAFSRIDANTDYNQQKMLAAFLKNRVSESHFAASTGYGYDGPRAGKRSTACLPTPSAPRTPWCATISFPARTP